MSMRERINCLFILHDRALSLDTFWWFFVIRDACGFRAEFSGGLDLKTTPFPSESWQHQAMAFLARCRAQMWGKHKEEPLAWLFRAGFTTSFADKAFFGWNFRPMTRNAGTWLGPEHEGEKYFLPSGLILPWIHEEKLLRLSVVQENGEVFVLCGSSTGVMRVGAGKNLLLFFSDGDFFRFKQENPLDFPVLSAPFPEKIFEEDLSLFEKIFFISEDTEKRRTIFARLREKDLPLEPVWLRAKGMVASILENRLTGEELLLKVSPAG